MDASLLSRYLRLFHNARLSSAEWGRLLARFGSLEAIAQSPAVASRLRWAEQIGGGADAAVDEDLQWQEQSGHHILLYEEADYPELLRQLPVPPPLLYVQGNRHSLHHPCLAMVGSRRCSSYGGRQARWLAGELSAAGLTICSGLARGIDTASHQGALAANGTTIAVIGTGIDQVYPACNRALAETIAQSGAVVSEFPQGTPPRPGNFPQRNRIICGLSVGTLVVEATLRSGSLISARLAMEHNRDVFAVPGPISQQHSRGCHALIKQGARLVESAVDVIEELPAALRDSITPITGVAQVEARPEIELSAVCRDIIKVIASQDCLYETLLRHTSLNTEQLTGALLHLEMAGLIKSEGGRYSMN